MNPHDLLDAIESVTCEDRVRKLAIYVHVPFCTSKCHFCDWVVDIPVSRLRSEQENLETNTSLRIDPTTIHHAYINHLAYTMSGLKTTRA